MISFFLLHEKRFVIYSTLVRDFHKKKMFAQRVSIANGIIADLKYF